MVITLEEKDIGEIVADKYGVDNDKVEFSIQDNKTLVTLRDVDVVKKKEEHHIGF